MSSRLHRTSGKAVGTGSTITLKGTACYRIVNRSTVHSLRLTAIESGNSYLFPRDVLFGDAAEGSCGVRAELRCRSGWAVRRIRRNENCVDGGGLSTRLDAAGDPQRARPGIYRDRSKPRANIVGSQQQV